jgi:thiol-disulfide isomerase/thioredoxin
MAKKRPIRKPCKRRAKKPAKTQPPPLPVDRVPSEPATEIPLPDFRLAIGSKSASPVGATGQRQPSAFWRPILAKPRWDWIACAIAILVLCLIATCRPVHGDSLPDASNYAAAYKVSIETGKPLLVFVGAEWCQPCKEVLASVGVDIRTRGAFVHLDWDRDRPMIQHVAPGQYPLPSLWIWERDQHGHWRHRGLHGAPAIRDWVRPRPKGGKR